MRRGSYINDECRMKETFKYITPYASSTIFGYPMIQIFKLYGEQ